MSDNKETKYALPIGTVFPPQKNGVQENILYSLLWMVNL